MDDKAMGFIRVSPYALTPLVDPRDELPHLDPVSSQRVNDAWDDHDAASTPINTARPKFTATEEVLTCRRICSLYVRTTTER